MDLDVLVVWVLRFAVPLVVLWLYFKADDRDKQLSSTYGRTELLAHRAALLSQGSPAPELDTLFLVDAQTNPILFKKKDKEGRAKEERRERRRRSQPEERDEKADETTHLKSLLNYIAFSNKNQHLETADHADNPLQPDMMVEKANKIAQDVLKGALSFGRMDVAANLYKNLELLGVPVAEETYALIIRICVKTQDLKAASEFLLKMEAASFCPDADLLDQVMDLYSKYKLSNNPITEVGPPPPPAKPQFPVLPYGDLVTIQSQNGPLLFNSAPCPVVMPSMPLPVFPVPPMPPAGAPTRDLPLSKDAAIFVPMSMRKDSSDSMDVLGSPPVVSPPFPVPELPWPQEKTHPNWKCVDEGQNSARTPQPVE